MAKLTPHGNVKVHKVPDVADKEAPTDTEINAGTDLTPFLPVTGVDIQWTQNNSSTPMLDESFTSASVGTESAQVTLTGVRDDESDDFWDAFTRGENFYLIVSRFGAPESGSQVEVYPVQSHRPVPLAPAENEDQMAQVSLAVNDTPELNAAVAAGA